MFFFQFVILQIQYTVPIVSGTEFSVKLPKVKAEKQHTYYVFPGYDEINYVNLSGEAITSCTEL